MSACAQATSELGPADAHDQLDVQSDWDAFGADNVSSVSALDVGPVRGCGWRERSSELMITGDVVLGRYVLALPPLRITRFDDLFSNSQMSS